MFTSLPYSPPLRSKACRIATIPSSFCTYSIVPYCLQGSLQSPTVSPSVVALLRAIGETVEDNFGIVYKQLPFPGGY